MLRQRVSLPIRPERLAGDAWEVAGWLSVPPGEADTLLILVHGGFYTHAYWDHPYQPQVYSCVQWAYEQGLSTLNIDRLGAGESSHPPGKVLDMALNAKALHQVVARAKAEGVGGRRFARCVVVGHSLGSMTASLMQATHGGADALVLTGVTGVNVTRIADTPEAQAMFLRRFKPAAEDPVFADRAGLYDPDYLTIPARRRVEAFYRAPPADPALIAIDETLKGTMTAAENASMGLAADSAARLELPVLVQVGLYDRMYYNIERDPDVTRAYARAAAIAPPNFTLAEPLKDAGHNLALHPNAREGYAVMADWLRTL